MRNLRCHSAVIAISLSLCLLANRGRGQTGLNMQHLDYAMDIRFDAAGNKFTGYQQLKYRNDSPDTLNCLFYHLFYNAFQHGSQMENRAMFIRDQDGLGQKIRSLKPDEEGYEQIDSVKIDGVLQNFTIEGTILKVNLKNSFLPKTTQIIECWFKSQVPKMLVRTGRNNSEQVGFTMTQWYPKLAAYDRSGWHPDEYIRREFYGSFANYDVSIQIDSAYTVAATGLLQNPESCGHGYAPFRNQEGNQMITWHFVAGNVHDFAWATDTSYIHTKANLRAGLDIHCFYKKETATLTDWQTMPEDAGKIFSWMEKKVGPYPYPVYSLVQGGSGGTEYPMLSMILGRRPVNKGLSKGYPVIVLAVHEIMHNWWYAAVANDETRNAWLDEGFALFFQDEYMDELNKSPGKAIRASYEYLLPPMRINAMEPMTTPSDYYDANWSYDASVYHKGAIFLNQLRYIVGEEAFWNGIKNYYSRWTFGHPDGDDFILCMEKSSGLQLKWYLDLWTKTNDNIDYAIGEIQKNTKGTSIHLLNKGRLAMPLDVRITLSNGKKYYYNIPLVSMYGHKTVQGMSFLNPWSWTNPEYILNLPYDYAEMEKIEIDPEKNLLDLQLENNTIKFPLTNHNKK
jgi:hypothetical protein